jgi:hypothetical protein
MSRYIYDSKTVAKGRKTKWCASCGKEIKIGESSITLTCFSDEFYTEDVCSSTCQTQFEADFDKEDEDEWDDEEDNDVE